MADITTTIRDVPETLKKAIADLEVMGIEVPASLRLAAILSQRHTAADDRRKP